MITQLCKKRQHFHDYSLQSMQRRELFKLQLHLLEGIKRWVRQGNNSEGWTFHQSGIRDRQKLAYNVEQTEEKKGGKKHLWDL